MGFLDQSWFKAPRGSGFCTYFDRSAWISQHAGHVSRILDEDLCLDCHIRRSTTRTSICFSDIARCGRVGLCG